MGFSLRTCTALDVTKCPSARFLEASFHNVFWDSVKASPKHLSLGPAASFTEIRWLKQLAALPQLTSVELNCGEFSPGRVLTQLPAGCELVIYTSGGDITLEESLPHCTSLLHLVSLHVMISVPLYMSDVDFSCLASCPNLREVWLPIDDCCGNCDLTNPDWVDLSTLKDVPTRCSVVPGFEDAAMHIGSLKPPAGWSVAPYDNSEDLICFEHGSQQLLA